MSPVRHAAGRPTSSGMRRLAAVAFLDVVSYSVMVETDAERTLRHWAALRDSVVEPLALSQRGRIVERLGDGLLLEFNSAVAALAWALAVQSHIRATLPDPREDQPPLLVRIAIHLGEVLDDGDKLLGDAVNIAARLQEHSDPGGIAFSAVVHEETANALRYDFIDLGPLRLKNIERPVRAFAVPGLGPAEARRPAALPSHGPSIAVMPFRSVGPNAVESYFVEGVVHDIVASLAAFHELFVISSSSTFGLAAEAQNSPEAARRLLGVRYVLTGTVTRRGNRLRLAVELTDADSRSALWSDRYEASTADLFVAQDAAATRIAYALLPQLRQSELRRALQKPPNRMDAYDLVLQALHLIYRFKEGDREETRKLLLRAVDRDPGYARAYSLLAHWHILEVGEGRSLDLDHDAREAARYSELALAHDASDPLALALRGHSMAFLQSDLEGAVGMFDRALAASPNSPIAWGMSSPTYSYLGDGPTAIARAEYALKLSPLDPLLPMFRAFLSFAHYVNGTHEESVRWAQRSVAQNPRYVAVLRHLIGSLVALGRLPEAQDMARRLLALDPGFRVRHFLARYPLRGAERLDAYAKQLLAAGLPE